jgi:hypothetical protein
MVVVIVLMEEKDPTRGSCMGDDDRDDGDDGKGVGGSGPTRRGPGVGVMWRGGAGTGGLLGLGEVEVRLSNSPLDVEQSHCREGTANAIVGAGHAFGLHVHDGIEPKQHDTEGTLGVYPRIHSVVHANPDTIDAPCVQRRIGANDIHVGAGHGTGFGAI